MEKEIFYYIGKILTCYCFQKIPCLFTWYDKLTLFIIVDFQQFYHNWTVAPYDSGKESGWRTAYGKGNAAGNAGVWIPGKA